MTALKKSDLYRSLWQSCDELRGGMDASQYKDYVLTLLFMKYVTDKYGGRDDSLIEVPTDGGFDDMSKLKGDKEIGDKINKIIGRLAEANDLKGVIDVADFNDEDRLGRGQEMVDRLSRLVGIFESVDFRANRAEGDDLLGDAYEYLMRHFATESGKSKGQFYTPAEVSRIMARVVGIGAAERQDQTIYDPTCGSGSLLLKAADEAPAGITIYGQENDVATWALSKMNMILHGHPTAEIWRGNTLSAPHFKDKDGGLRKFDFAVANPPFSMKAWSNGLDALRDEFRRFEFGVPPEKNGDYAFLLHFVSSLKGTGKGAIILPHGVLFRGNREGDIRRSLVTRGYIKGLIGLPANLFYGTGIPACIVIIDKAEAQSRDGIFMIDASKGFIKDGNKNRLRSRDIHRIVDVFNRGLDVPGFSRMVPVDEIASAANDYNLNIPRYVDSSGNDDVHDLDAHMRGGVPNTDIDALAPYWSVFPSLRGALFGAGDRSGYSRARVETVSVKATVVDHPEFKQFVADVMATLEEWKQRHDPLFYDVKEGSVPRAIIDAASEALLESFTALPLVNEYSAYQRLMDCWAEFMQDDIYLVSADGWRDAARPRPTIDDKERKIKEVPDLVVGKKKFKMDLLPPALMARCFFPEELSNLAELERDADAAALDLEAFVQEHAADDGPLEDAKNDKGDITKSGLAAAMSTFADLTDSEAEWKILVRCSELFDHLKSTESSIRKLKAALDAAVLNRYGGLTEDEARSIVIEDKWYFAIRAAIESELELLADALAGRIRQLEERYDKTLPQIEAEVATLAGRVEGHLKRMGLTW